jgi:hypothetical protein
MDINARTQVTASKVEMQPDLGNIMTEGGPRAVTHRACVEMRDCTQCKGAYKSVCACAPAVCASAARTYNAPVDPQVTFQVPPQEGHVAFSAPKHSHRGVRAPGVQLSSHCSSDLWGEGYDDQSREAFSAW